MNVADLIPRMHAPVVVKILREHPDWRSGAEIGVAQGRTSLAILKNCPDIKLIGVEPFRYIEDSEKTGMYEGFDFALNERLVDEVAATFPGRYVVMKKTSLEAVLEIENDSLDFVFIDASHMYREVRDDILAWRPKVKRTGWIMGHDYCNRWSGVVRAVDEILGKPMQFGQSVWAVPAS